MAAVLCATPALAQASQPVPVPAPPPAPVETWLARPGVELAGLDKITTRVTKVEGKVGQPLVFGTLTAIARSCLVRGPDQPADQAVYLDVTDSRDPAFGFHGWMLLSSPGVSVIEHPVYDLSLTRCTG